MARRGRRKHFGGPVGHRAWATASTSESAAIDKKWEQGADALSSLVCLDLSPPCVCRSLLRRPASRHRLFIFSSNALVREHRKEFGALAGARDHAGRRIMAASSPTPTSTPTLLACTEHHIPAIQQIIQHYVRNTVITLALTPPTHDDVLDNYRQVLAQKLPFIVAVDRDSSHHVLGFAYLTGFRGARKGYRHTVELSLFCHPQHTARGIGRLLLQQLIDVVKRPDAYPNYVPTPRTNDERVRMIIACMSVDETAWKGGLGLRDFYLQHGFEQVGHFPKVGHKFDRWYVFPSRATS